MRLPACASGDSRLGSASATDEEKLAQVVEVQVRNGDDPQQLVEDQLMMAGAGLVSALSDERNTNANAHVGQLKGNGASGTGTYRVRLDVGALALVTVTMLFFFCCS